MPKTDLIRAEVQRLLRAVPFRKFHLVLESGDPARIEHPENIAFDPEPKGSRDFYVISGKLRLFSTSDAVSAVSVMDQNGAAE